METLGERIRFYRKQKGLTQKELADSIGVKHNSVSDWENDKNKPYADTIELLLGVFEIDANKLLGRDDPVKIKADAELFASKIVNNSRISEILPYIAELKEEDMDLVISFIQRLTQERR